MEPALPAPPIAWAAHYATLAGRFGPRRAVTDLAGAVSYGELVAMAAGLARRLVEAGVAPGEIVASFLANGRAAVACGIAAQIAGAAEMPLNIGSTAAERVTMLGVVPVRHAVCARADAGFFADHGLVAHPVEEIVPEPLDAARFPAVASGLPGRILFTSGTSGTPKAVLYTQRNRLLAHLLLRASQPFAPGPGDAILLMTPYAHGASLQAHAWLDHGATLALLPGVVTERAEAWLGAGALRAVFAAPTVLAKLAASFPGRCFPGIRAVFTGTAPLTPRSPCRGGRHVRPGHPRHLWQDRGDQPDRRAAARRMRRLFRRGRRDGWGELRGLARGGRGARIRRGGPGDDPGPAHVGRHHRRGRAASLGAGRVPCRAAISAGSMRAGGCTWWRASPMR